MHLKIRLKMVFAKDNLAVIVTCFAKMDGLVLVLQKNFQTRSDRQSGWSWTALSVTRQFTANVHILLNAWRPLLFSPRCTDLRDMPMIRAAWRWVLWVPGLSSCDWQSCSTSARFSSVIAVTGLPLPFLRSVVPVLRYFVRTWLMLW